MQNFFNLNFDQKIETNFLDFYPEQEETWSLHKIPIQKFGNIPLLNYFKKIKFSPSNYVNFFIGPGNKLTNVHSDSDYGLAKYALNYVWGDESLSNMSWYDIKPNKKPQIGKTTAATPYSYYLDEDVVEIEKKQDEHYKLVLVRIDVPHRVQNNSSKNRYCLSFRGTPVMEWEKIVNHFSEFIEK